MTPVEQRTHTDNTAENFFRTHKVVFLEDVQTGDTVVVYFDKTAPQGKKRGIFVIKEIIIDKKTGIETVVLANGTTIRRADIITAGR